MNGDLDADHSRFQVRTGRRADSTVCCVLLYSPVRHTAPAFCPFIRRSSNNHPCSRISRHSTLIPNELVDERKGNYCVPSLGLRSGLSDSGPIWTRESGTYSGVVTSGQRHRPMRSRQLWRELVFRCFNYCPVFLPMPWPLVA